jgi:hypothetical protein
MVLCLCGCAALPGELPTCEYHEPEGGVFNVCLGSTGIEYRFALFENPHALCAVAVPPEIAKGYPRYNSSSVEPARVGGKPWFVTDVLEDEEWLRDQDKKVREEALRFLAERDRAVDPVDPRGKERMRGFRR